MRTISPNYLRYYLFASVSLLSLPYPNIGQIIESLKLCHIPIMNTFDIFCILGNQLGPKGGDDFPVSSRPYRESISVSILKHIFTNLGGWRTRILILVFANIPSCEHPYLVPA